MKVTDEQIIEALAENGHRELADALEQKLGDREASDEPRDMNTTIRRAAGR